MPPYSRRPRGWDWFTPAEVRHLEPAERQRLTKAAFRAAREDRLLWLFQVPAILVLSTSGLIAKILLAEFPSFPPYLFVCGTPALVLLLGALIYFRQRHSLRRTLRAQMLAEGIRPAVCFECRYFTEGFEGTECPVCGALLYQGKANLPAGSSSFPGPPIL